MTQKPMNALRALAIVVLLFAVLILNLSNAFADLPSTTLRAVAWSPNGQYIAVASQGGSLKLFDAIGNLLSTFQENGYSIYALAWHPDSIYLASGGVDAIKIWEVPTGNLLLQMYGHSNPVSDLDWSLDGTRIASASFDSSPGVIVWNAATGDQLFSIKDGFAISVAWSPDGNQLAFGTLGSIQIWDPAGTGQLIKEIEAPEYKIAMDWHPSGELIAAAEGLVSNAGSVRIWDVTNNELYQSFNDHTNVVSTVAWNPDGTLLASADHDGTIRIWNSSTGERSILVQETSPIFALDWNPDGTRLAYGGEDGTLKIVPAPGSSSCTPTAPADPPTYTVAGGDVPGLIAALTAANASPDLDVIALGSGTYTLTAADNILDGPNGLPAITTPITLHGHCATIERDPTADPFRFFSVRPGGSLALYDLALTGGSSGASDGGAIDAHGPVAVTHTTFTDNTADDGGAIAIDDGTLTVTGSAFTNNTATSNGGAIDLDDTATGQVVDSAFSGNTSTGDGGAIYTVVALDIQDSQFSGNATGDDGGAVASLAGALTVTGSTFDGNTAATNGGAIETDPAVTLTLTGCTFTANTTGTDGGAVGSQGGTVTVTTSTFTANTAGDDGGALASQGGVLTVSDSTLDANTASLTSGKGGGLYVNTGSLAMTDVIFSGNTVYNGGGLYFSSGGGAAQITGDTTFTGNTAVYRGGGLFAAAGNVTLDGATVTLNTAENGSGGGLYNTANLAVTGGSIIGSNTAAGNGGGIWNSAALTVSDSTLSQNVADLASGKGGGVYSVGGSIVLSASDLSGNQAYYGGGLYVGGGTASLSALLSDNVAGNDGGGVYVVASAGLTADASTFDSNTASDDGGGLANKGAFTIINSQFLTNSAGDGGAVHTDTAGSNALTHSCISGNTATGDTGGVRSLAASLSATGSWWGAANGPSGAGPGSGDAVNANVTYTPFLTEGCPGDTGAGAAAAAALQPSITVLEQQAAQLDTAQFLPVTPAAALPFTPSLEDEALWQVRGAWDLARLPDRGRFGWAADATPRAQTSVLELVQPVAVDRRARPQLVVSQHLALAGADTLFIEVLPSGSADWVVVDTQTGATTGWVRHSVDLAAFRGQTIRLRFRLVTGEDQPSEGVSLGVWLDDIAFQRP